MNRRAFLQTAAVAAAASAIDLPGQASSAPSVGQFKGKIKKSLKWGMVQNRSLPLVDIFRKLRECGFDGVEPNIRHVTDVAAWSAASRASGLVIDGTVTATAIDEIPRAIEMTRELGGDSTLVVASYPDDQPITETWKRTQDKFRAGIPFAQKHGIRILVENVWNSFLISPFDMVRFIDEIDSPWVQVHFDIGNMIRWGIAEHWAQVLGTRSKKLDVKEFSLDKAMNEGLRKGFDTPLGEGSVNWPAVRVELAKINYSGWAAAEVKGGDWPYLTDVARRMDHVLDLV